MTAAVICMSEPGINLPDSTAYPPINFFYSHFHNSIRAELDALSAWVVLLQPAVEEEFTQRLLHLKERYHFLNQVYKYHSSVEDEERLLEQLSQLLNTALAQQGAECKATIRQLVCKVEEIHTTLRKHLAKEEEQLLPLLQQHFSFAEQAELVAQFLYCIPLATVERVLSWLKPAIPEDEQQALLTHIQGVIPDNLLLELLVTWLRPGDAQAGSPQASLSHVSVECKGAEPASPSSGGPMPSTALGCETEGGVVPNGAELSSTQGPPALDSGSNGPQQVLDSMPSSPAVPAAPSGARPPLQAIVHVHHSIRSALDAFVREARALLASNDVSASQLGCLLERHRFLRGVCMFHTISEEEVLFPAVRLLLQRQPNGVLAACSQCTSEHQGEVALFEDLGRMLADVRAFARRGRKEVVAMLGQLCQTAERVADAIRRHMELEECEILPMLEAHLDASEQRAMVWRTLRAMPLRLLERVMPWLADKLDEEGAAELLTNMRLGAPDMDATLVELLSRWAYRRRQKSPDGSSSSSADDDPRWYANDACEPRIVREQSMAEGGERQAKKQRRETDAERQDSGASASTSGQGASPQGPPHAAAGGRYNPIDHIFQFHKALRQELQQLEKETAAVENHVLPLSLCKDTAEVAARRTALLAALQQLDGRFHFLWGIYRAHSKAEDEIVFPALEAKEALHNVSHAYTLDHQAEEQLFVDIGQVLVRVKQTDDLKEMQELALQLRRMCAAVRASLETHVRAEESELWPLFAEHFTTEEQQYLVGIIIGRTGAEVLQAMLPWVTDSFNEEERGAMMECLREATKNTKFERWLDAITPGHNAPQAGEAGAGLVSASSDLDSLADVAQYLRSVNGSDLAPAPESSGVVAESSTFRPGWEDIFRMNQQQLEAAIRRVSCDPSLEPERKAYLMQNIMVSRYIVGQQRRMGSQQSMQAAPEAAQPPPLPQQAAERAASLPYSPRSPHPNGTTQLGSGKLRTFHDEASGTLGCRHYRRKAQLVAPCCAKAFTCRFCHDEASEHKMDRYAVSEVLCMACGQQQPAAAACRSCGTTLARYYCNICHLYDDEPGRDIYHCPFCNVCRQGKGLGVDFFHCMNCDACMSLSLFNRHVCREKAMEANCPVCHDCLFDSSAPIKELPCGHFMHSSCFAAYTQFHYTCPICAKSVGDMSVYFQMVDSLLAAERLPPEYAGRVQNVLCNDCGLRGTAPFHFVYHKCSGCSSYNTRVL